MMIYFIMQYMMMYQKNWWIMFPVVRIWAISTLDSNFMQIHLVCMIHTQIAQDVKEIQILQ